MNIDAIRLSGLTHIDLPMIGLETTEKFIIKGADGLGPTEQDVFFSDYRFMNRIPQSRQVVLRIGLNPNWSTGQTAGDLRDELYGLLTGGATYLNPAKIFVRLQYGGFELANAEGYVKGIEIVPFAKDPEVQITINCPEPYWFAGTDTTEPSLIFDDDLAYFDVTNEGTAPTGIWFEAELTASSTTLALTHVGVGTGFVISGVSVNTGDVLKVNTKPGSRSIKLETTIGGVFAEYDMLSYLNLGASFPMLHGGVNQFELAGATGIDWTFFRHNNYHWGI